MGIGELIQHLARLLGITADVTAIVPQTWTAIAIIVVTLSGVIGWHFVRRAKERARFQAIAEMKHKASHLLRDNYFDLFRLTDTFTAETLSREAKNTGTEFVNFVAEILNRLSGQEVNVCIKAVDNPRQPYPTTKEDWDKVQVYTLCRSSKSKPRPQNLPKLIPISGNTDFMLIMRDQGDIFAIPNLKKYNKNLKKCGNKEGYLNSSPSWKDFYRTTIVAPIRIEATHLGSEEMRYDLLGFLCADSMSVNAFQRRQIPQYAQLMLSFGDDLYSYFWAVTRISERIKTKTINANQPAKGLEE